MQLFSQRSHCQIGADSWRSHFAPALASPASRHCHVFFCAPAIPGCLLLPLQFSGRRWQPPSASFEEPRPAHKKTLELKLNQSGVMPLIMASWLLDGLCLLGPLGPWLAGVRSMKYGPFLSAACEFTGEGWSMCTWSTNSKVWGLPSAACAYPEQLASGSQPCPQRK